MLYRSTLVALAMVASATAQYSRTTTEDLEVFAARADIDDAAKEVVDLGNRVDNADGAIKLLADGLGVATATIARVDGLVSKVKFVEGKLAATKTEVTDQVAAIKSASSAKLAANAASSKKSMNDFEKDVNAELAATIKAVEAAEAEATASFKKTSADLSATLAQFSKCAASGKIFDGDKCVDTKPESAALIPKIYHRGWDNNDGRESGYVNNRHVTFKKEYNADTTFVRVTYYDNMRVHGHGGCHANWNVMFCNAAGGDCNECSDPGRCNMNRYSSHQHGWWMNDHKSSTIECVCKRAGSKVLKAGKYQLKGWINKNSCDLYTGHHDQFGSMIVKEVYKMNSL